MLVAAITIRNFVVTLSILLSLAFLSAASAPSDIWNNYTPNYLSGSGEKDWWINYPDQSGYAGSSVSHPRWILESLKERPVLIFDYSNNCKSCALQKKNIAQALEKFGNEVTYFDVSADNRDIRAFEVLQAYSLSSEKYYVPTTVLITLIKGRDGMVEVAWHSVEDAMSEEEIDSYMKDAIYFYHLSSANWSK